MFRITIVIGCLLLAGCNTAAQVPVSPIAAYGQQILNELVGDHQFVLSVQATQQTPVVVMQPTPVIITPNPTSPVTVTPVTPPPPVATPPGGITVVTPNARRRKASHIFDDNPLVSAASLNAAQLSQLVAAR